MANHQENYWEWNRETYKVIPGQFITSLEKIADKCGNGVTIQNIRTALKRFKKLEFLTDEPTNKGRVITIINWRVYQPETKQPNKQTNRQLTSSQQAANRQLTPNNNDKNDNNNNIYITPLYPPKKEKNPATNAQKALAGKKQKNNYAEFVSMTDEEHSKLIAEFGEDGTGKLIGILDNYKGSNGKRYRSDYRAILSWVVSRYQDDCAKHAHIPQPKAKTLTQQSLEDLGKVCEEFDRRNAQKANKQDGRQLPGTPEY